MKWKSQMPIEATTIAVTVLPSPKTGKNASADQDGRNVAIKLPTQ
jgi:hypothetical protein